MRKRIVNLPNLLTTFRIVVMPLLAVFIVDDHGIWACWLLILAGISDVLDGWIARKWGMETVFGRLFDPIADKVLLAVAVVYLVARPGPESLSPLIGTLLLSREFLVTGLRAIAASEGLVIAAGQTGKIKTFSQYIGLGALMVGGHPWGFASYQVGIYSLWISVILSYASMIQYMRAAYMELKEKFS